MPPKKTSTKKAPAKKASAKAAHRRTVKKVIANLEQQGPVVVAPGVMSAPAAVVVPATAQQPAMIVPATATGIPTAPTMPTWSQVEKAESSFEKELKAKSSGLRHVEVGSKPTWEKPEWMGGSCNEGYFWDKVKKSCEPTIRKYETPARLSSGRF